jgi:hypothetical protein
MSSFDMLSNIDISGEIFDQFRQNTVQSETSDQETFMKLECPIYMVLSIHGNDSIFSNYYL